jgi:hypothetical protein
VSPPRHHGDEFGGRFSTPHFALRKRDRQTLARFGGRFLTSLNRKRKGMNPMVAEYVIQDGVMFTTPAGFKLLEKHGGVGVLPYKIVNDAEQARLKTSGAGHVLSKALH